MKTLPLLCLVALAFTGCTSPWEQFYSGTEIRADYVYGGTTRCFRVDKPEDVKEYLKEGYAVFGESNFNAGGGVSLAGLQSFGEKAGADIVLYWSGNARTTQTAMVIPHYNPGTQQTTYLNGYGSGGSFSGTATTYSPGTYSTEVVPMTVTRMDYSALFLRKRVTKPALGVSVRQMTSAEASEVGTNSAIVIDLVIRRAPAFEADVMDGDYLLEIDGTKIPDVKTFLDVIEAKRGRTVTLLLSRRGNRLSKTVRTNP
jgi:PDZ domain